MTIASAIGEACEALLSELLLAGYEGASLRDAFARQRRIVVAAIEAVLVDPSDVTDRPQSVAPAIIASPASKRRRRAVEPNRDQLNFMLASAGGQAKAAPMTAAERQARSRARRRNVTQRDINGSQVFEITGESRNVTKNRDAASQGVDMFDVSALSLRDSVTGRGKKRFPQTPLRKTTPPYPQADGGDCHTIPWDSPLIPFIDEVCGPLRGQFGRGRTIRRKDLAKAEALMAERFAGDISLKATGT